jgi:hypothetical protein
MIITKDEFVKSLSKGIDSSVREGLLFIFLVNWIIPKKKKKKKKPQKGEIYQ